MKILCHSYIYITESTTGNIIKMQHMYATSMKTIRIWCKSFISKLTIGRGDKGSRGYLGDKGSKGDRGLPGYPGEHGKKIYYSHEHGSSYQGSVELPTNHAGYTGRQGSKGQKGDPGTCESNDLYSV